MRKYSEDSHWPIRAQQVWLYLIGKAPMAPLPTETQELAGTYTSTAGCEL